MKKYKVEMSPITGIHIGKGEELDLFNYVLFQNKEGVKYGVYSLEKVINGLNKDKKDIMYDLIDGNDVIGLRKFFSNNISLKHILYSSDVNDDFIKEYDNNIDNLNNQLLVNNIQRNPANYVPVIPGSSIKGAIRTALINEIINSERIRLEKKDLRKIENIALGYYDAKSDPLRGLIVRDGYVFGNKTDYVTRINIFNRRKGFERTGQKIFIELIRGKLLDGDAKSEILIEIINDYFNVKNVKNSRWFPPKRKISINYIIRACNNFYRNVFDYEKSNFYSSTIEFDKSIENSIKYLNEEINNINSSNECLIRVGRYSQVESMTIEEYRNPKAPKGWGKSRTLAYYNDMYFPLGWMKLKFKIIA